MYLVCRSCNITSSSLGSQFKRKRSLPSIEGFGEARGGSSSPSRGQRNRLQTRLKRVLIDFRSIQLIGFGNCFLPIGTEKNTHFDKIA